MSNVLLNQLQSGSSNQDNSNQLNEDPAVNGEVHSEVNGELNGDANMNTLQITDDLESLLSILPERIRLALPLF
jgi:hypothetical protein